MLGRTSHEKHPAEHIAQVTVTHYQGPRTPDTTKFFFLPDETRSRFGYIAQDGNAGPAEAQQRVGVTTGREGCGWGDFVPDLKVCEVDIEKGMFLDFSSVGFPVLVRFVREHPKQVILTLLCGAD
jgi:hypothetical protein